MSKSSREVESSLLLERTAYYSHSEFHLCNLSTPEAATVWGPVWDFGRIWQFRILWEGTELSTIRACFQSYWRVLHWSQFAPEAMTQRHGWGLQGSKGRTGAENCEPSVWQTVQGNQRQICRAAGTEWCSSWLQEVQWFCVQCTVIQWSQFDSLFHIPCSGLLSWVHKCSLSWRKISVLKYSFRQLATGGSSAFKGV